MIKSKASVILLQAPKYHGLYCIDQRPAEFIANTCLNPIDMHKSLGHISQKSMKRLFKHQMITGLELQPLKDKVICDICIKSKITWKPLPKESSEQTKAPGKWVYSDV
jgi:hypothetical protein